MFCQLSLICAFHVSCHVYCFLSVVLSSIFQGILYFQAYIFVQSNKRIFWGYLLLFKFFTYSSSIFYWETSFISSIDTCVCYCLLLIFTSVFFFPNVNLFRWNCCFILIGDFLFKNVKLMSFLFASVWEYFMGVVSADCQYICCSFFKRNSML